MAGGTDVGYYTLPVILSFSGVDKQVNSSLGKAFGVAGKKGGQDFARSVAAGIGSDKSIEKATEAKAKAADRLANALGQVKVAQANLTQAEARGNIAGRARALEAVAAAERKVAAETRGQVSATKDLDRAIRDADSAKKRLNDSGSGGGFLSGTGIGAQLEGLTSRFGPAGTSSGGLFVAGAGAAILAGGLVSIGVKAAGLVAEGFSSIVSAGVDFDRTMNNFQGVTKSLPTDMEAVRQKAIALGGDVQLSGTSAADAAAAMTELAKGGFSVQQSMEGARGSLTLATAAQISAAEAANIQASALSSFGLGADQAGHVADLLANVSNKTQGEITDFALALSQAAPAAHSFGLSIDDTLTSLGVFAKMGMRGSDAGTSLKTMLLSLTKGSKPAVKAMNDLGVSAYDAAGNFVGMPELFKQLADAQARLKPQDFQAGTNALFGSDAIRGAMIAGQNGLPVFEDVKNALEEQGGAAALAAAQTQGLPGVIENVTNTIDTMKLSLYDMISGPLKSLGGEFQNALGGLSANINSHKPELIGFFTDLATTVTTSLAAGLRSMGLFTEGIGQMIGGIGNIVGVINQTAEAMAHLTGDSDKEKYFHDAAQGAFGWGEGLQAAGKGLQTAADKVDALTPKLQNAGDAAKDTATFVRDVGDKVKLLPDSKTIVLKNNLDVVGLDLDTTKYKIENLPDGQVSIVPLTDEATREMEAWRKSQEQAPPTPLPITADTRPAQEVIDSFKAQLAGRPANVPQLTPPGPPPPGVSGLMIPPRATGGIYDVWDAVASFANGKLPQQAMIQAPVGGAGLVQWAEPSTGGEAFIPLNGGKRSRAIWAETGRRLMSSYADGGIRGVDALYAEVQALTGTQYSMSAGDDCSGTMSQLVNAALGLPPKTDRMSTGTAAKWLANKGALPGLGPAGTFRMGWKNGGPGGGHMAGTLPDGTHVEMGGANGGYTVGGNAAGAEDPQFTDHAYLPFEVLYPDGYASGSGSSPFGSSSSGSGGMDGVGPNGEAGTYTAPTDKQVREAQEKVDDADKRVAAAEQRQRELKADAKQSQKDSAQTELDKAKREAADARTDQADVMKGKFKAGKGGKGGKNDVSEIGSIFGSFMKETFGLDGSLFPDIGNLAPVKMLGTLLGAFGGGTDGLGGATDGATTSSAPFGMPDVAVPPPGSPASGSGLGPLPGPPVINVDGSTTIAGNVGWDKAELDKQRDGNLRRAVARVPVGA